MTHISFQERGAPVEIETDYVVVGSGAGGASAAVTLARGGAKVVVVESGAWRDPSDYPHSSYGAMRDLMDNFGATVTTNMSGPVWPVVQGKAVGGSTVINSAICVRTPGDIFERWQNEFGVGGNELAQSVWTYQDQIEKELFVQEVPEPSLGNSNRLAILADQKGSFGGHVMRRYVRDCAGSGQCLQGCRKLRKQSLNLNYLPELMQRRGAVISCAPVKRIDLQGTKATGVHGVFRHPQTQARGSRFTVRATKGVIIAASAVHSPLLLMRSGVRSPALGNFFRAHPGSGIVGCYDEFVDMNTGATQGWASTQYRDQPGIKLETLSLPFEMLASRMTGGGTELMERLAEYRHFAMWVQATRAESVGTIRPTLWGTPGVSYVLNAEDMHRFREGMKLVARMHFAAGANALLPGIFGLPYKITRDQLHLIDDAPLDPRAYVAILSHLFGGCVMGKDPAQSVCNGEGQVHGYQGLYIADASAIPSNLGVNPQHTIMALAMHFAERLLNKNAWS